MGADRELEDDCLKLQRELHVDVRSTLAELRKHRDWASQPDGINGPRGDDLNRARVKDSTEALKAQAQVLSTLYELTRPHRDRNIERRSWLALIISVVAIASTLGQFFLRKT